MQTEKEKEIENQTRIVVPVYKESKNKKEIPSAVFIEKVEAFCIEFGVVNVIESLTNALNKFQFTEGQFQRFKNSMLAKLPEIEKAIETIRFLKANEEPEMDVKFMLNDGIFCKAHAKKEDKGWDSLKLNAIKSQFYILCITPSCPDLYYITNSNISTPHQAKYPDSLSLKSKPTPN